MVELLKNWPVDQPVPAISLRQPWASAVAAYCKDVENRSRWPFKYRGPLIIHASATRPYAEDFRRFVELAKDDGVSDEDLADITDDSYPLELFPLGCIVAVANLADVFSSASPPPADHPMNESPWKFENAGYWLYLEKVGAVEPVAFKGFVGMFKIPHELAVKLEPIVAATE